jgi:hypothetical protein
MQRYKWVLGLALGWCCACGQAQAGWGEFWSRFHLDRQRMNAWPEPFIYDDWQVARTPIAMMKGKGWQLQNTIADDHFDRETQRLTRSGEIKLYAILNDSPADQRTIFVLRGHNPEATAVRMGSVHATLAQMLPDQPRPAIVQTSDWPRGWSADQVDDINVKVQQARPAPVLPAATSTGVGTGG